MRRIPRDPQRHEGLDWLGDLCHVEGLSIRDASAIQALADAVREKVGELVADPDRLRGVETQSMFESLVVELGSALVLKKEDLGKIYATEPVQPPDYRITLRGRRVLLVEVKDQRLVTWKGALKIKRKEFHRYQRYAELAGGDLKFCVFWSDMVMWTLVDPAAFRRKGKHYVLDFDTAFMQNEMYLLGDRWLCTRTPLRLRIVTDDSRPRELDEQGFGSYTIKAIEMYCQNTLITDRAGRNLAFFMMLFGRWASPQPRLELEGRTIIAVNWEFHPECNENVPGFCLVDPLSSMFSRLFWLMSRDNSGTIKQIVVKPVPGRLSKLAPRDYPFEKSGLSLRILEVHP